MEDFGYNPRKADQLGQQFGKNYSIILTDATFERRLKSFDPNLKLMFDQTKRRWCVLEWALDHSGWNVVLTAEDDEGEPKPLGEWVFNKLYVWRHNNDLKLKDPNRFFDNLIYEEQRQRKEIEYRVSLESVGQLIDDRNQFRKAAREIGHGAPSDVTAGYPNT